MLRKTFFNYKIKIKTTAATGLKNEVKYYPMSEGNTCIAEPNLQITNPYDIANTFNNYFGSQLKLQKKSIKYSQKHFSDYLLNESDSTTFLLPTDKEEIANITSSLKFDQASGPSSIPYRILFLLKNKISKQLVDLFNLSFMTAAFSFCTQNCKSSSCF